MKDEHASPATDFIALIRSRLSRDRIGGKVARGASLTILVNASGAAVSFIVQIVLARNLGESGFGTYVLVMGWLSVALVLAKLELDTASVRFVGRYLATNRLDLLRGYLRGSRRAVLASSISMAVLGAVVISLVPETLAGKAPDFGTSLMVACALLPIVSLLMFEGAVLQGLQRYARAQIPLNLVRPVVLGVTFGLLVVLVPDKVTAPDAVAANLMGALVAFLLAWAWRRREVPAAVRQAAPAYEWRTWAHTAYPLFAVSLAQLVISHQSDVVVVGAMLSIEEVAYYGAASTLTLPLVMAAASVTFVAQPLIADLYARQEMRRLQSLIRAVSLATAAVAVPIALGLIVLAPWLLSLWEPQYAVARPVLVLLTLAQLTVGLVGSLAGYLLTMTSHEKEAAWIIGLSAALNLILAIAFTPIWGAVGTASATLIAASVRAAVLSIYIRRTMGLQLPAFRAQS